MIEITGYSFFWNVTNNEGSLNLRLVDDKTENVVIDSPQEASLLLDVLRNEKPVFYNVTDNIILTGIEPVGEGDEKE